MEKIFFVDKSAFASSEEAIRTILAKFFNLENAVIYRSENGKPYLQHPCRLFFSVSHTKEKIFVAFADQNVGIDAEPTSRQINLPVLLKKFPPAERIEIKNTEDFLRLWTIKESAIKWLGGTLAHDLDRLSYIKDQLFYNGINIPVFITKKTIENHIVSVCSEQNFTSAEIIHI